MQNFEVVVVDDPTLLDRIGAIGAQLSEAFLREHVQLLSRTEEELRRRKFGLLGGTLQQWTTRRAPGSEGDVLGMIGLGCVLGNTWLTAHSLGVGCQALSASSMPGVEQAVKPLLGVPDQMKIAYAVRLGHPVAPTAYLRVRREVAEFAHWNRCGRGLIG